MLNVVILKKNEFGLTEPVHGTVSAAASNLTGQLKNLGIREIIEQDAIYYIGETPIAHQETLIFDIDVTPIDETRGFALRYTKQFFTR